MPPWPTSSSSLKRPATTAPTSGSRLGQEENPKPRFGLRVGVTESGVPQKTQTLVVPAGRTRAHLGQVVAAGSFAGMALRRERIPQAKGFDQRGKSPAERQLDPSSGRGIQTLGWTAPAAARTTRPMS